MTRFIYLWKTKKHNLSCCLPARTLILKAEQKKKKKSLLVFTPDFVSERTKASISTLPKPFIYHCFSVPKRTAGRINKRHTGTEHVLTATQPVIYSLGAAQFGRHCPLLLRISSGGFSPSIEQFAFCLLPSPTLSQAVLGSDLGREGSTATGAGGSRSCLPCTTPRAVGSQPLGGTSSPSWDMTGDKNAAKDGHKPCRKSGSQLCSPPREKLLWLQVSHGQQITEMTAESARFGAPGHNPSESQVDGRSIMHHRRKPQGNGLIFKNW